jgi:large subunit ribosomal protein L5
VAEKEKAPKPDKAEKAAKAAKGDKAPKADAKPAAPKTETPRPTGPIPNRLFDKYKKEIIPALAEKFGRANPNSMPRVQKICVNMGVGKTLQDKNRLEQAAQDMTMITGQKAQITKAKHAISGFRLRENNEIGCRVTLRGKRMYEFLDRLICVALPRIRDFRGINPNSFDGHGNYTFGVTEQAIFPEVDADKMTFSQGMDITIVTSTDSDDEARELLKGFGMPFRET